MGKMINGYKLGLAAIAASIFLVGCGGGSSDGDTADTSIIDDDTVYKIIDSELYNKSISADGITIMFNSDGTGFELEGGAFVWSINDYYELLLVYADDQPEIITFTSSPSTGSTIIVGSIPYTITSYVTADWSLALADYSYVFIYKNISTDIANTFKTAFENYQGYYALDLGAATAGDMSCTDLGFTTSNIYYNETIFNTGYGSVTYALYYSDDFSKACSEVDYGGLDYVSGSTDLALTYNFSY